MRIVILVPRREDGGWRDQLWEFCRARWEKNFPDWPIYEGEHLEGPFNRSMAINRASKWADMAIGSHRGPNDYRGGWDVALIIDSDTVSDPKAVRRAVDDAWATGALSVGHDLRHMMLERPTRQLLNGTGALKNRRQDIKVTYKDSVSCAVAIRRDAWDLVGGFDERFVGWGFEDTGFQVAVETLTGQPLHRQRADCFHLWHPDSPEASHESPTYWRNRDLKVRYLQAHWQPDRVQAILDGSPDPGQRFSTIPKILHRTVPEVTPAEVERWWKGFADLHPLWEMRTYREPIDPADWPLTGDLFERCQNGAQKAGLIRLEALVTHGGVYVDSDVEPIRPLDPLVHVPAFAAWEDERCVPDAVLGSMPGHPAFMEMLKAARASVEAGEDAWKSGPGVTTRFLPSRDDVLLLPPGSFYPVHYKEKRALGTRNRQPWVFLEHKWHHSWGTPTQKAENARNQRIGVAPASVVREAMSVPGTKFAVCMPWRDSGDDWRRRAHDWCVRWWEQAGFTVFKGSGPSRSAMCNKAALEAIDWGAEVLVIVDADTWTQPEQIVAAVRNASMTGHLTHAFTSYVSLGSAKTQQLQRRRGVTTLMAARGVPIRRNHVSGASAITTDLWQKLGGFDERFVGWGFEDQAFNLAAECVGGAVDRIDGYAVHWYHRADPTKSRTLDPGDTRIFLMERYCRAAGHAPAGGRVSRLAASGVIDVGSDSSGNIETMRSLLAEEGGPLSQETLPTA